MEGVFVSEFLDHHHPDKNGKCLLSIRLTYKGKRKYYPTDIRLSLKEYNKMNETKRLTKEMIVTKNRIAEFIQRTNDAIKELEIFTFNLFERKYFAKQTASHSISVYFDEHIESLKDAKRIGTAVSYEVAKRSYEKYATHKGIRNLCFADIDSKFLTAYENWMLSEGKSLTTVGIYARSLRTIFNKANVVKGAYPFDSKNKDNFYDIPTGNNIKKALKLEEIGKIFNYKSESTSALARAKDYWIFIYLCNGINVKDFCLLKRKNIVGNTIRFIRSKTKATKRKQTEIVISLKSEAKAIINRWGQPSINSESYIFPHLQKGMSAEVERATYQQVTKSINKYMKRIANELGIDKQVTSYYARHSFANILKNSGASIEFIGEALGHSDSKTTNSYLKGFEEEQIHKTTDALMSFEKNA